MENELENLQKEFDKVTSEILKENDKDTLQILRKHQTSLGIKIQEIIDKNKHSY